MQAQCARGSAASAASAVEPTLLHPGLLPAVSLTVGKLKLVLERLLRIKAAQQALLLVPPADSGGQVRRRGAGLHAEQFQQLQRTPRQSLAPAAWSAETHACVAVATSKQAVHVSHSSVSRLCCARALLLQKYAPLAACPSLLCSPRTSLTMIPGSSATTTPVTGAGAQPARPVEVGWAWQPTPRRSSARAERARAAGRRQAC